MPLIVSLIVIAIIIVAVYIGIQVKQTGPAVLLTGPIELFNPKSPLVVDRPATKANMSGSYTLSFYLRIDAVPDMRAAATPVLTWPGVWNMDYNPAQKEMIWTMNGSNERVVLPNVPMQRWTQVGLAFEGRTMDLYVNGALIKSHSLLNVPRHGASSITIVPNGIMGQLALTQLWTRRLTISELGANYVDTSDSQGRPYLGPAFLVSLNNISVPNLFCPSGNCTGSQPVANPSQAWEFPYA